MPVGDSKTCTKCGANKPLDAFYKQPQCKFGRHSQCKDCIKAGVRARRDANIEEVRAYDRMRAKRDAEKKRAIARAWYHANHERGLATRRAHYQANKDTYLAYSAKRKAYKRGVERVFYTRTEIYDRDGGCCKICGISLPFEPNGFEIDHIVPFDLGGVDTPANVQLACRPCNRSKWNRLEGQIHLPV